MHGTEKTPADQRRDASKRAEYGKDIVQTLSEQLTGEYGAGFGARNLARMVRLAEVFPDGDILSTLLTKLGWSHFLHIIQLKDPLQRDFYAEMCRLEGWSVRTLQKKIGGMLFERTALSKKSEKLVRLEIKRLREEDRLTPDLVFRDPQKRIQVDGDDFYLDLLFFHRKLRRLVAVELKLDRFRPEYKGQMELYLRWLERHEQQKGEEPPIGLILCAGGSREQIELLQLDRSGIRLAQYLTDLPPQKMFAEKLRAAVAAERQRLAARAGPLRP
jgi:predicted nuclease of restriction endonuclease-like (RecB) superfamily